MRRRTRGGLAGFCLLPLFVGCLPTTDASPFSERGQAPQPTRASAKESSGLPLVGRIVFLADEPPEPPASPSGAYRGLTERACQCLAVASSGTANLLDQESDATGGSSATGHGKRSANADLKRTVRRYAALEARNQSAAAALERFFRLAEAEGTADLLDQSGGRLADAVRRARELREKGLRLPVEPESLERQQADLEIDRVRNRLAVEILNEQLRQDLGSTGTLLDRPLWPLTDLAVPTGPPVAVEPAVRRALACRPELRGLREVRGRVGPETLPAVRMLLGSTNGLLGSPPPPTPLALLGVGRAKEAQARGEQVDALLRQREQAVTSEVRQAVAALEARRKSVTLAHDRAASLEKVARDKQERQALGFGSFLEATHALLESNQARGELLRERVAYQLARVKLKQAQGLFVYECHADAAGCPECRRADDPGG